MQPNIIQCNVSYLIQYNTIHATKHNLYTIEYMQGNQTWPKSKYIAYNYRINHANINNLLKIKHNNVNWNVSIHLFITPKKKTYKVIYLRAFSCPHPIFAEYEWQLTWAIGCNNGGRLWEGEWEWEREREGGIAHNFKRESCCRQRAVEHWLCQAKLLIINLPAMNLPLKSPLPKSRRRWRQRPLPCLRHEF